LIRQSPEKTSRAFATGNPRAPAQRPSAFIGTAGWSVPPRYANDFCGAGTHLERYATRLNAVEINSSFYRPHRRQTYARWAASVPERFRFAVKVPREMTHECALIECAEPLDRFAAEVTGLGAKLGVLLVQIPPSRTFDADCASQFFSDLHAHFDACVEVACEPRHRSWFTQAADSILAEHEVARVAADPPRCAQDGEPGGWQGLNYYRLHGSPHIYYSNYDERALERTGRDLDASRARSAVTWCIFDNTAAHAALGNALTVRGQQMQAALKSVTP
jgi:uncharacterized protein YecE (DUF72 family)